MESSNSKNTAETLVDITLRMIDARGGLRGLNLREIAREAGCAHTNVYNYFDSYDAMVLAALKTLLSRLIAFTQERIESGLVEGGRYLEAFLAAQIDFASAHPGWYHLVWFDKTADVEADPELSRTFEFLRSTFNEKVFSHFEGKLDRGKADEVGDILHGLLHGEICKLIGGRGMNVEKSEYRLKILADCRTLLAAYLMLEQGRNK